VSCPQRSIINPLHDTAFHALSHAYGLDDPRAAAFQAVAIARDGEVRTATGTTVGVKADTLCLHGDNPSALANARAVRAALQAAGITLRPLAP